MKVEQRNQITKRTTLVGALVNTLLAFVQIVFGLLGHSQALLADGIHTLSDLASDFIVLLVTRHSAQAADKEHPYGHGRIETLASVLLGLILIGVGFGIGYRGVSSMFTTRDMTPDAFTLFFAALAIVSKEGLYRYTLKVSRRIHSTLLATNAWHHRTDVISSVIVLCGIAAQISGLPHMDSVAAVIVAVMISYVGYQLTRKALDELIDTSLDENLVNNIRLVIEQNESIKAIHSLRTRSMGGLGYIDAEIRVNPRLTVSEAHHIAFLLEQQIKARFAQIIDVGIHVDPFSEYGHHGVTNLPSRHEIIDQLNDKWSHIACSAQIHSIHLHYLNSQVEIDLVLPLELADKRYQPQLAELVKQAGKLEFAGKVTIYFLR